MTSKRPSRALSPISHNRVLVDLRSLSKSGQSFDEFHVMDERSQDENTQSSGSAISGLSQLESETDDFGRQMLEHTKQRDRQRMRDATTGRVEAFRKARPRPRIALTMENLERNDASTQGRALELRAHSPPSQSSSEQTTPLNLPLGWGRKGKQKNDFLGRINTPGEIAGTEKREKDDTINVMRTAFADGSSPSDLDWMAEAVNVPLPPAEQGSHMLKPPLDGEIAPRARCNDSLDRILELEQEDFLHLESPTASVSSRRKLSENSRQQREIDDVKGRAVATNRLEEMMGQSPKRRSILPRLFSKTNNLMNTNSGPSHDAISTSKVQVAGGEESASLSIRTRSLDTLDLQTEDPTSGESIPQRVASQKQGPRALLHALARSASVTPSPPLKIVPQHRKSEKPNSRDDVVSGIDSDHSNRLQQRHRESVEEHNVSPIRPTSSTSESTRPPSRKGSKSPVMLTRQELPIPPEDTDSKTREPLVHRTPQVTGAWVDTPAGHRYSQCAVDPSESNMSYVDESQSPVASSPKSRSRGPSRAGKQASHPKSALEALIQEAHSNQSKNSHPNEGSFGDDTLNSLREIAGQDTEYDTTVLDLDEDTLDLINNVRQPVDSAEAQRQHELQTLQRMNERLRTARAGVREARNGMKRMEHQVEEADGTDGGNDLGSTNPSGPCKRCGCPEDGALLSKVLRDVWRALRRQFYVWPKGRRLRLTWLGMLCSLLLVWSISEVTLCEYYCHPLYATTMKGYGVDIHAPRMPYVTTTILLKRPFSWLWRPLWNVLYWALRFAWRMLGNDTPGRAGARVLQPSSVPDWGIGEDEYI